MHICAANGDNPAHSQQSKLAFIGPAHHAAGAYPRLFKMRNTPRREVNMHSAATTTTTMPITP